MGIHGSGARITLLDSARAVEQGLHRALPECDHLSCRILTTFIVSNGRPLMTVIVVATVTPMPEHRADIIALFEKTIARVHDEDGCELYAMHEDTDTIVMIEKWRSAEDLEAHSAGAAMTEMNPQVEGKLLAKTEIKVYTPHPAGDPDKGQL